MLIFHEVSRLQFVYILEFNLNNSSNHNSNQYVKYPIEDRYLQIFLLEANNVSSGFLFTTFLNAILGKQSWYTLGQFNSNCFQYIFSIFFELLQLLASFTTHSSQM